MLHPLAWERGDQMSDMERQEEFTEFVLSIGPRLHLDAYRMCGDWHEAEDLTQMTLHKLYRRWDLLSRHDELAGYARQALLHTFCSEHRRPHWTREVSLAEVPDMRAVDDLVEDRMTLADAMRRLGPRQRAVVILRFWADLSVEQTAAALGCSTGTVTSQTHRALLTLRHTLSRNRWPAQPRPGELLAA